jgi:hypothetical protein
MLKRKKKTKEDPSRCPEAIAGWIVEMFAEDIIALRNDISGERIEVWLGVDPFIAQNMVEWIRAYIKSWVGPEEAGAYYKVILETKQRERYKDSYHIYVVRK